MDPFIGVLHLHKPLETLGHNQSTHKPSFLERKIEDFTDFCSEDPLKVPDWNVKDVSSAIVCLTEQRRL